MPLYSAGQVGGARKQFFRASGSFTVPEGIFKLLVTAVSGGRRSTGTGSPGFQGRMLVAEALAVTPGQVVTVTLGAAALSGDDMTDTTVGALSTLSGVSNASTNLYGYGVTGNMGSAGAALIEW